MAHLRLIADDLTGALDTAAQFVAPDRPIPVFSGHLPATLPDDFAIDSGTREMDGAAAVEIVRRLGPWLAPHPCTIAFKKLDSLLRGNSGLELAAVLRAIPVPTCVIAPAFPFQGRVTRAGIQFARRDGSWHPVGEDLRATLQSQGFVVRLARPGEPVPEGVSLWDAETDEDLRQIAAAGRAHHSPVLWSGSGGLAAALSDAEVPVAREFARPILGLFGSDHPMTLAQLAACGRHVLKLPRAGASGAAALLSHLGEAGISLVNFELPPGLTRGAAAEMIAAAIMDLSHRIPRPRTLFVSGGETLRAACLAVGADHLDIIGQVMPGVPFSIIRGGRWEGVPVISKSGAFGQSTTIVRLLGLEQPVAWQPERFI